MKELIKKEWIKALNSGKYIQGKGRLRTDDNFCCLGVLCDLYDKDNWDKEYDKDEGEYYYKFLSANAVLPHEVIKWAGLSQENPHNVASLNDTGKTFKQIAKIINENL